MWIVTALVGFGLLLIAAGGVIINLGNNPSGTNPSLVATWGPVVIDFGLFLFIGGLLLTAVVMENLDVFVRLFLLVLSFVVLLLILTSPFTYFVAH